MKNRILGPLGDGITHVKLLLLAVLSSVALTGGALGHEIDSALADLTIEEDKVVIELMTVLEAQLMDVDLSIGGDLSEGPTGNEYLSLTALPDAEIERRYRAFWPSVDERITLTADGAELPLTIANIDLIAPPNPETPRYAEVTLVADLDAPDARVVFGWDRNLGPLVVRQQGKEDGFIDMLPLGGVTPEMTAAGVAAGVQGYLNYVKIGFEHIIPLGLDHILFVLGLFFFALAWRPMLWQVSTFTVAHMITLALAALGVVSVPGSIVEPLIAASIVYVAVENIWGKGEVRWPRIALIFTFGLLHGLGFAGVLSSFLAEGPGFVGRLLLLTLGVELGQIAVLIIAFVLIGLPFGKKPWYRSFIAIPASIAIALVGAYWTIERVFF